MRRCTTGTCSITLPLKTEKWQEDRLDKRFELGRLLYNTLLMERKKAYRRLWQTQAYRKVCAELDNLPPANGKQSAEHKALFNMRNSMLREAGFNEYGFTKAMTPLYKCYSKHIDSNIAQVIARDVWKAYEKYLFGQGRKLQPKQYGEMHCLSGQRSRSSIRFFGDYIWFNGLEILVKRDAKNLYETEMLLQRIKFCRVLRKYIKGRYRYFVQVVLEGKPALKKDMRTGEVKWPLGNGDVGCYVDSGLITYASAVETGVIGLSYDTMGAEKRYLQRKMKRSLQAVNPRAFSENEKMWWKSLKKSNRFRKIRERYKEICRRERVSRQLYQYIAARNLITKGDRFYFNYMKSETGATAKMPVQFLKLLDRKVKAYNGADKHIVQVDLSSSSVPINPEVPKEICLALFLRDIEGTLRNSKDEIHVFNDNIPILQRNIDQQSA